MPVEFKDYYKTLGVPRTASHDDIRKAFRKLARQYHPDVAKDKKRAEENSRKSTKPTRCWATRTNARSTTNSGPIGKTAAPGRRPAPAARPSAPIPGAADPARRIMNSAARVSAISSSRFSAAAARDGRTGDGERPGRGGRHHGDFGRGDEPAAIRAISVRRNTVCPDCHGTGVQGRRVCPACGGDGYVSVTQDYKVKIPPGVRDGQRCALAGKASRAWAADRPAIVSCAFAWPAIRISASKAAIFITTWNWRRGKRLWARVSRCRR
jgi:hypothetical protein